MNEPVPLLLTISEAAKRLGRDRKTLYRWIETGELRAVRIGGRRWVAQAEIDRLAHHKDES